jgi:hypothetical protein
MRAESHLQAAELDKLISSSSLLRREAARRGAGALARKMRHGKMRQG